MLARFLALPALAVATCALAAVSPPAGIGASIRAPAGEEPAFVLHGEGSHAFECRPLPSDPNRFGWAFTTPEVTLYDAGRMANRFQNVQVCSGVACDFGFFPEEINQRMQSLLNQLPRNNETITAVVTLAAENGDLKLFKVFKSRLQSLNNSHSRILHQKNTGNAKLLGR